MTNELPDLVTVTHGLHGTAVRQQRKTLRSMVEHQLSNTGGWIHELLALVLSFS